MISTYFNEQVNKNNVLVDESNILDVYCIEKLNGLNNFSIIPTKKYGYILILVKGIESNIVITYSGVTLKIIDNDGEYLLPINYIKDEAFLISGSCDKLVIKLYGAKFEYKNFNLLLPLNNLVLLGGSNKGIYSYSDCNALVKSEYTKVQDVLSSEFVQTFIQNDEIGLGKLDYSDGLKFTSSFDDYESEITISDELIRNAIYIQKFSNNIICFVYVKDNKVYFKIYNQTTQELFDENQIIVGTGYILGLVSSATNSYDSKFFGVVTSSGVILYVIKSTLKVEKVYEGKIDNIRIFENDKDVKVVFYDKYLLRLLEFDLDESQSGGSVLLYKNTTNFLNVQDVLEYNNMYIYTNFSGEKGVVNNE